MASNYGGGGGYGMGHVNMVCFDSRFASLNLFVFLLLSVSCSR